MIRDSKKKFFENFLTNIKNSKDTWRVINLLINRNSYAISMNGSDIPPDILNNLSCNVHSKVITTDKSANDSLTALNNIVQKELDTKANQSLK